MLQALQEAFGELSEYLSEVSEILKQPALDRGRLTTVRLKVAQLRLNRVMLLSEIVNHLGERVSREDSDLLDTLRKGNAELLAVASAHTTKWDLATTEENWDEYRSVTQKLINDWLEKMRWEQAILFPLLSR